jgi:ketosteroid isomerase-like protein
MATGQTDAESALRKLDEEFVRHANGKDIAALVKAFYSPDAALMPPNSPVIRGADQIRGFWQGLIDAGGADVTLETSQIESSGDLAYGIGRYTFTLPSPGGERARQSGKYLVVFRRQSDGSWQAIADMFSGDQPAG